MADYVLVYAVNVTGIKLLQVLNVESYYGGAFMIIPMALLAFFLNRKYVFRRPEHFFQKYIF